MHCVFVVLCIVRCAMFCVCALVCCVVLCCVVLCRYAGAVTGQLEGAGARLGWPADACITGHQWPR